MQTGDPASVLQKASARTRATWPGSASYADRTAAIGHSCDDIAACLLDREAKQSLLLHHETATMLLFFALRSFRIRRLFPVAISVRSSLAPVCISRVETARLKSTTRGRHALSVGRKLTVARIAERAPLQTIAVLNRTLRCAATDWCAKKCCCR
jgi:hypothetical protein